MKLSRTKTLAVLVPVLWFAALGSAAACLWCKHTSRELFVQLQRLDTDRDNLDIQWGQLQLEQSAWSQHAFVENVATDKLHMSTPPAQQIRVVSP
jgi:cell division protein FtsL